MYLATQVWVFFLQAHSDKANHSELNSMKNNSFAAALEAERKAGHCLAKTSSWFTLKTRSETINWSEWLCSQCLWTMPVFVFPLSGRMFTCPIQRTWSNYCLHSYTIKAISDSTMSSPSGLNGNESMVNKIEREKPPLFIHQPSQHQRLSGLLL